MAQEKSRVACLVDGFNLYHAIDDLRDDNGQRMDYLKWLDLWSLASAFITPQTESITSVYYFSAFATWIPDAYRRHRLYTAALEAKGVTLVMGKFKEKHRGCKRCGAAWIAHEEKETDVNFAIHLLNAAHTGAFDRALLVTADSDICPVIRMVTESYPAMKLQVLTPPGGYDLARELRGITTTVRIKRKHLHRNLLPVQIMSAVGTPIDRPEKYQPPAAHF